MPSTGAAWRPSGTVHYSRVALLDHSSPNLHPGRTAAVPFSFAVTPRTRRFDVYIQTSSPPRADLRHAAGLLRRWGSDRAVPTTVERSPPTRGQATCPSIRHQRVPVLSAPILHGAAGPLPPRRRDSGPRRRPGADPPGYRVDHARHFVLRVVDAAGPGGFCARSSNRARGCRRSRPPSAGRSAASFMRRRHHGGGPCGASSAARRLSGAFLAAARRTRPRRSCRRHRRPARRRAGWRASPTARACTSS